MKLPTGALTAFLGLLLIRAQFIPGLSALDSSAQIVAWAIVLGYSQEIFTHVVDRQARTILAETQYGSQVNVATGQRELPYPQPNEVGRAKP